MESFLLSKVSPTGVFRKVQLKKVKARETNYQNDRKFILSYGKAFLMDQFKTLDETVEHIYFLIQWDGQKGKKLSDFGDAELELLLLLLVVQHFKEALSNMKVPTASFAKEMLLDEWFTLKLLGKHQSLPHLCKQVIL